MPGPWLKFYPADWQADPLLGTCSLAARGLWIEMLCLMHAADPPGSLARNGEALTIPQIAVLARCGHREVLKLLAELESSGVFSRDDDGMIFSRRIRRDIAKAERDRENGRAGGNPSLKGKAAARGQAWVNPRDNPSDNGGDKAQKPEARSQRYPSRADRVPGGGRLSPGEAAAAEPDPAAWDSDAPFGRLASGGGCR